jgi:flagellin
MSLLNSVNTNMGAMIALESLNQTNTELAAAQKQVSTGYRVADSTDDGAAYAIAQSVRSTVGGLTSANQQLGNVQGLLSTTQSGLNDISNTMNSMRDVLVKLADPSTTGNDRANYVSQYKTWLQQVQSDIQDSYYNGKTLIGNIKGSTGVMGAVGVVRNEVGATYSIASFSGSALYHALTITGLLTSAPTSTTLGSISASLSTGGNFIKQMNNVNNELNTIGGSINYVDSQVTFNNNKIDALNSGVGALVDADLAKESAQLQSLQIRQQLGTQALSLANQAPQTLLSLFK